MTDDTPINPDEGWFYIEVVPNLPWPPQSEGLIGPSIDFGDNTTLTIKSRPDSTLLICFENPKGNSIVLESCPISLEGEGYFKLAIAYSESGATIFAGGKRIASNEPGASPEQHVEITLKKNEERQQSVETAEIEFLAPTTLELFDGPRAKLNRAKHHISDFQQAEQGFLGRDPYIIVKEFNSESTKYTRLVRIRENIPDDFALIIGDAIHNLRTALDLLASDLVRANGGCTKGVYFPFCENGEDIDKMIKRRKMHRAAPDVVDMIRSLKPYHGGNDLLRGLHDLDIADKHILIIPVAGLATQPVLDFNFVKRVYIRRAGADAIKLFKDGTILDTGVPANVEIDDKPRIFSIAFAEGQPFAGSEVIYIFEKLTKLIDGIVETFASHVLGSNATSP